jgi:hypothetical protein|tara:strand:- start:1024 stop:1221 length:198 start_codon:yes stop_codon:yes gene_type:complete
LIRLTYFFIHRHIIINVAASLFRGTGQYLAANCRLFLYGPFKRDGWHTAAGNAQFDATLRRQNPE